MLGQGVRRGRGTDRRGSPGGASAFVLDRRRRGWVLFPRHSCYGTAPVSLAPGAPMIRFLACLLLLAVPTGASAHEFWIGRDGGEGFVIRYGHAGHRALPIDRAKIRVIRCGTPDGERDLLPSASFEAEAVRIPAGHRGCGAVSTFHHGGFYCLTPDGERPIPKRQCREAIKSWESRQYAKWIDIRSPLSARPLGDELEIVPVTDLAAVGRGDKATFRVLHRGEPVSGAVIAIGHRSLGETDGKGEARVKIRGEATETVSATLRWPMNSEDADTLVLEASLTFEVAK
jgi:hypothetical protein